MSPVLFRLVEFMRDKAEWSGTATELLSAMGESGDLSTVITKWLNEYRTTFLDENGICYGYRRKRYGRQIVLTMGGDSRDSDIGMPSHAVTAVGDAAVLLSEA